MKTFFFISLVFLSLICCNRNDNFSNKFNKDYYESLLDQNLYSIKDSILIGINDGMIVISKKHPFVGDSRIMLHEINTTGTFTNKDFNSSNLKVDSAQIKYGAIIYYGSKNINIASNTRIRIGEYYRNASLQPINIWSTEFNYKPFKNDDNIKTATKFLGINPKVPYMNYVKEQGVFFKTSGDLYLWIVDNTIFFIREKISLNQKNIMFHILRGNTFLNLDFDFKSKLSKKLLLSKEYEVAELKISEDIFTYNIRIGEYVMDNAKKKNLWAQQINMHEVQNNELLKFNNEIEEAQAE